MTSYHVFCKHALKVAKSAGSHRPILKGIHHTDNFVEVTDSHRLYRLKSDFIRFEEPAVIDVQTGRELEGMFPDLARLVPDDKDAIITAVLKVHELASYVKALVHIEALNGRKGMHAKARIERKGTRLLLRDGLKEGIAVWKLDIEELALSKEEQHLKQGTNIIFNLNYLKDALALYKEAGETEITLRVFGSFRPFTLTSEDVSTLILPIKNY